MIRIKIETPNVDTAIYEMEQLVGRYHGRPDAAVGAEPQKEPQTASEVAAEKPAAPKPRRRKAEKIQKAPEDEISDAEVVSETPPPAKTEPEPPPAKTEPEPPPAKTEPEPPAEVTKDQLVEALQNLSSKYGTQAILFIMKSFGAENVSGVMAAGKAGEALQKIAEQPTQAMNDFITAESGRKVI